jgi:hypothetical protein
MRYYFFISTDDGGASESPTTLGLTIEPLKIGHAAMMIEEPDRLNIVDVFTFTAPRLWPIENQLDLSVVFDCRAELIISVFESGSRFSRPEEMLERIKNVPENIVRKFYEEISDILANR